MTSSTGEFSSARKDIDSINTIYTRNAFSASAKNGPRRKLRNLKPLRLLDIEKELQEAEKERLQSNFQPIREEESPNKENQSTNTNDAASVPDKSNNIKLDPTLPLATPAKPPNNEVRKESSGFVTPFRPIFPKIPEKPDVEHQFITPKNKIAPKIQCTVDMQPYLKTPLDKICSAQSATKRTVRQLDGTNVKSNNINQHQELAKPLPGILEYNFKKIWVNNDEYIVLNELGKGGSSEVFHCFNATTKQHRAIKIVSLQNPISATGFINEIKMLQTLQKCNRIIKMFDYEISESTKTLLVVLEVGGMDLSKILKESALGTSHMPMYMLLYYWMEMLYAVKQIHAHGIIHSDLKPANFLKAESYLKLIDFGIASCVQNDMTSIIKTVPEGSFNYISPEALNNENSSNSDSPSYGKARYKISYKSDVWSLGCILYQLVYRRTPFQEYTQMWTKLSKILNPDHEIKYPPAEWVPPIIIETIKKCLQYNSKLRPSVDELIEEYETLFEKIKS